MLYRHTRTLLEVEGYERDTNILGPVFRIRPADGDAPEGRQSFVLWSTLTTRDPGPGQSSPKEQDKPTARLVFEVSEDARLWVPMEPHPSDFAAQAVRIPFLLSYVRVRVYARGQPFEARAVLCSTSAFTLQRKTPTVPVVVVGRAP